MKWVLELGALVPELLFNFCKGLLRFSHDIEIFLGSYAQLRILFTLLGAILRPDFGWTISHADMLNLKIT